MLYGMTLKSRRAFTLVEVMVAIGLVAILFGMLLPMVQRARALAAGVSCQGNLGQLSVSMTQYTLDYNCYPWGFVFNKQNATNGRPADPKDLDHVTWFSSLDKYLTNDASLVIEVEQTANASHPQRTFSSVFKCPSVPSSFKQQIQYAQHGVVMPLQPLELGKTPSGRAKLTWSAKLIDVNPDTALLWDTPVFTGPKPDMPMTLWGTQHTSSGLAQLCTTIDDNQISGGGNGLLCHPEFPERRFRGPGMDRFANSTNILKAPVGPIAFPSDAYVQAMGFPISSMNTDYINTHVYFPGVARFRHEGLGCNVLFADGSVRTLHLDPTRVIAGSGPFTYIDSEFKRHMLMTKWPGGGITDSNTYPTN